MSDSPFTRPVIRPDADILARVPGLCLGCLVHEVEVEPSRPDCQDYLDNELAPRLVVRMEGEPLAQWPNLGPSRAGCKACGKDPGRYRISSEALYRRLKQGKGLYAINSVVDANNIASLETGFSLGSYTLGNLRGDITFRRGLPGETYEGIGKGGLNLENLPLLEQFGFACEDFGAGALLVREVPADIDAADTVPTLEEFAERLRTGRSPDEKREALLHTMACKAAIKGGWVSDPAELRVLVDRVQSGEIKYCPHGRPVAVKLTKYELEKMFKRA